MSKTFAVSYNIISQESAESGDFSESGFIAHNATLREALEYVFQTRTCRCESAIVIEANDSNHGAARWVTVYNGAEFETGDREERSLHFPDTLTGSTRARIVRFMLNRR